MSERRYFSPAPTTTEVSLDRAREWAAMEDRDVPDGGAIGHRAWAMAVNERNAVARLAVKLETERAAPRTSGENILARNTRVLPGKEFVGEWIAVPEEDFVAAREQFAATAAVVSEMQSSSEALARRLAKAEKECEAFRAIAEEATALRVDHTAPEEAVWALKNLRGRLVQAVLAQGAVEHSVTGPFSPAATDQGAARSRRL